MPQFLAAAVSSVVLVCSVAGDTETSTRTPDLSADSREDVGRSIGAYFFDGKLINESLAQSLVPEGLLGWDFVTDEDGNRISGGIILHFDEDPDLNLRKLVTVVLSDEPAASMLVSLGGYHVALRIEQLITHLSINESGEQQYSHVIESKVPSVLSSRRFDFVGFAAGPRFEGSFTVKASGYEVIYSIMDPDGTITDSGSMSALASETDTDACPRVAGFASDVVNLGLKLYAIPSSLAVGVTGALIAKNPGGLAAGALWGTAVIAAAEPAGKVVGTAAEALCEWAKWREDATDDFDPDVIEWEAVSMVVETTNSACPDGTHLDFVIVGYKSCDDNGEYADGTLVVHECRIIGLGCAW